MPKADSIAHGSEANGHTQDGAVPRHMPAQVTPFVGRQREVAGVRDLLQSPDVRLLTLTGPPGIGKTRLAVQVVSGVVGRFPDGVYFVSLASVSRPESMVAHIAQALGLREMGNQPLLLRVQEHLRDKQLLLALDNLEQIEGPAATIGALFAACPLLKILATSRTRLQVYGEHEYRVPGMALPDQERLPGVHALSRVEAVALFVQRAQAARADFKLTEANAEAVARLCVGLDGLPLAIELAAARTRSMTPQAMLSRLHHRLDLLGGGPQDLPLRHQTLREAIAWSYDLLTPDEQQLYRRLAVFYRGATTEAIRYITAFLDVEETWVTPVEELVESLHDKSLLTTQHDAGHDAGEARFSMLETIREYASERLSESAELEPARKAHALFFQQLAVEQSEALLSTEGKAALHRLEMEHENVLAALGWCASTDDPEGVDVGLRLVNAMSSFWDLRGYLHEQHEQITAMLSRATQTTDKKAYARLLLAAGRSETMAGNEGRGKQYLEEGLSRLRDSGDTEGIVSALAALGHTTVHLDEIDAAEACFEECLAIHTASGNRRGIAHTLGRQADLAMHKGDIDRARQKFSEALALAREVHAPILIADLLTGTGYVRAQEGEYDGAVEGLCEAIEIMQEMEAIQGIAYAVGVLGKAAYMQDRHEQAARVFAAASTLFDRCGLPLEPPLHTDPAEYRVYLDDLRGTLGERAFNSAWGKGRKLRVAEVLAEYRGTAVAEATESQPPAGMTPREIEVLRLIAAGMTNSEAADALTVSPHTVNMHLRSIYGKLGVTSRSAATRFAVANNLV
ncbi:MAG: hypothetical protein QOH93_2135 [Chloroflexia bacterium]|jgi:predicted ATPase/DNA-binding CsgD family transcriptional regulator|nr:hypothetical protein [Chloroflexia bacterium]